MKHLGGLEQGLGKAGGKQAFGCSLFAWLQERRGLGTQRLPGRELHRDGIPEGHKGYSSHPNTTRRHFGEKLGPPGLAWSFHGLHAAHLAKVLWEPARFSYSL